MLHTILVHKYIKILQLFLIILLLIWAGIKIHLASDGDDLIALQISTAFHNGDFIFFLKNMYIRYMIWSGRFTVDAIMLFTIYYTYFWKIAVPLSLLLTSFSINRMACKKVTLNYIFLILIFLLLIPVKINNEAVWWVTGFYCYLLPLSVATYVISFILSNSQSKIEYILCIFCVLICAYTEQAGFYFLGIVLAIILSNKEYRTKKIFFLFLLALVNYVFLLKAPGNHARYLVAAWGFFPEYMYYSWVPKIYFGVGRIYSLAVMSWNLPFLCFLAIITYAYFYHGKKSWAGCCSFIIVIAYIILMMLKTIEGSLQVIGLDQSFFSDDNLSAQNWYLISTYISYFLVAMTIVSCITLLISTVRNIQLQIIIISIFFIAILDTLMIGFSPTVYLSGNRVDYFFEVCLIIICVFLLDYIKHFKNE